MPDEWIDNNSALGVERTHALGAIAFSWNLAEYWSIAVLTDVLGVKEDIARAIAHDMGMTTLWTKIVSIASKRGFNKELVEGLKSTRNLFETNRLNRNLYVHALAEGLQYGQMQLTRNKGDALLGDKLDDTLETMRRVSDEIGILTNHLQAVSMVIGRLQIQGKASPFPQTPQTPKTIQPQQNRQASHKP